MKYRSTRVVTIEPMLENTWIMAQQAIPGMTGGMRNGYRKGYKITEVANGKVSWISKDDFEKEFVEISEGE